MGFCWRFYKQEKKKYYNKLDVSRVTDDKSFWKNVKHLLSSKVKISERITVIDTDDNEIHSDTQIAATLNSYFETAVKLINENRMKHSS